MTREEASVIASKRLVTLLIDTPISSIHYDYGDEEFLKIIVSDYEAEKRVSILVPEALIVSDGQNEHKFRLKVEKGPGIVPAYADAAVCRPKHEFILPAEGGDPCYIQGQSYWGTAGIFLKGFNLDIQTGEGTKYHLEGRDAFWSCNHVIAGLDTSPPGTTLVVSSFPNQTAQATAVLGGFLPTRNLFIEMDFACGINMSPATYRPLRLRKLGDANPVVRNPGNSGEDIFKSGARTAVTKGKTTGRTTIRSEGAGGPRWYYGVYRTTPGFADHGDSGSIVIGYNNDIVGMVSWVDNGAPPVAGYFFTLGQQDHPFSS